MFKLVAIRILKGCDADIRKCLHENAFYYLCNDYSITDDGKEIRGASNYISLLPDSFFDLDDGKGRHTVISLQAIIGMNGDGKSSLVEIALRLINNFALCKGMSVDKILLPANKVCAQLYYLKDGSFYCLSEEDGEIGKMRLIKYKKNVRDKVFRRDADVSDNELKDGFFYTLVSNYSHYAYNTLEYYKESSANTDEDCWIHHIFHKNDGYQVPLSLHPYRNKGNIDINREKELTKPRLVRTLVKTLMLSEKRGEGYEINGKKVVGLKLTDIGYSKFQRNTLEAFFKEHRNTSLLWKEIETLQGMDLLNEQESDVSLFVGYIQNLKDAYKKYFGHERNRRLYGLVKDWMSENDLLNRASDISIFINSLREKASSFLNLEDVNELTDICKKWETYADFNLCQIQRIELIDDICDQWRSPGIICDQQQSICLDITPEVLMKSYDLLNEREKCLHYILYKTISIFETYESYGKPCSDYVTRPFFFDGNRGPGMSRETLDNIIISRPFAKLGQDWLEGSHITLKLRQTYNFYQENSGSTYALYFPKAKNDNRDDRIRYFDEMPEEDKARLQYSEQLPPAIYYWDLVFKANSELVELDSFSSGEKQSLFSKSAILYHLQNINSVTTETFHYHSINVVLEEIELYFHPEWQRIFCYDLIKLITEANLQNIHSVNILFVTHSPYILSDIPKTNVLFIRNGRPVTSMQENTFGANINGLLKNGFFMPSLPMGEFAYRKINMLFAKLHSGNFGSDELEQIKDNIMIVGEPTIRFQLLSLYNSYKQLSTELEGKAFRNFIKKKLTDDKH